MTTEDDYRELGQVFGAATKDYIRRELDKFEARIVALEARPQQALKYVGTWQQGLSYRLGDAVTKNGSLWICKAGPTTSEPEIDHVCWQLAVKRGKDGRDGKDVR